MQLEKIIIILMKLKFKIERLIIYNMSIYENTSFDTEKVFDEF